MSMSLRRPVEPVYWLMVKKSVKTNLAITFLSGIYNFMLPGVPNNSCDSTKMFNVDKGIALIDNISKLCSCSLFGKHRTQG